MGICQFRYTLILTDIKHRSQFLLILIDTFARSENILSIPEKQLAKSVVHQCLYDLLAVLHDTSFFFFFFFPDCFNNVLRAVVLQNGLLQISCNLKVVIYPSDYAPISLSEWYFLITGTIWHESKRMEISVGSMDSCSKRMACPTRLLPSYLSYKERDAFITE